MRRDSYDSTPSWLCAIGVFVIVACLLVECGRAVDKGTDFRTEIGTVTDKGTKRKGDEDKYLVYTVGEDGETRTYEVTDSFIAGRFNSSDVYAGIEVGKTYEFTVAGGRNGFMSWYPNIYEYKEILED